MAVCLSNSERLHTDDYLTDGKSLVRVLDVSVEWVEIEDCLLMVMTTENALVYARSMLPVENLSAWRKVVPEAA